jgi:hypothetical protein
MPNSQLVQNQSQRSNLPSTEPFAWQNNNTSVAAQQPPLHWNNENRIPNTNATQAPFHPGQIPQTQNEPRQIHQYPAATNFSPNQLQNRYQNGASSLTYPQLAGNQQPMPPQVSGQYHTHSHVQTSAEQQSDPIQKQALTSGLFLQTPMQSGPMQPQAFNQGSFSSGPIQSSPIQLQTFNQRTLPPNPMQSGPMQPQAFKQGAFFPSPRQSGPIQSQPQAFNQGSFLSGPMQPQTFSGTQTPSQTVGQVQQYSPVAITRSAGIVHSDNTPSKRKIFVGIGAGLIIALIVAVGYLAFMQKPATPQITTPVPQIAQTHTKNLPKLPPITVTDPQALYTQATGKVAIINDPLRIQSDNNWVAVNSPGTCTFDGNTLHTVSSSTDTRATMCLASATKYSNIAFQAQLTIIKGDTYGLVMRADSNGKELYLFGITTTGMYTLAVANGQNGSQQHILAGGTSTAIKQGQNQSNQLTIIARDSTLYIYINNTFITKVDDTTATIGSIGLFNGNSLGDTSEARFTNVKVWSV